MTENWRNIPGYPNYQISIDYKEGRCRCLNYKRTGKIKELSNKSQRICWNLRKDGTTTSYQAAKWIALTFPELIENEYFEGAEIDHIDTNVRNNHPSNLRWVDRTGNMNNPLTKRHKSESLTNRIDQSKQVLQFTREGILISTYPSIMEAQRQTGINNANISQCCLGKYKTAGGYVWKYNKITA